MLEGVKLTARVAALAPLSESIIENVLPGNLEERTDEEIMEFISRRECSNTRPLKADSETLYHPMCTCKIGAREDGGVVDSSLKVYGVSNLRVCDASVFPDSVSGHPVSPLPHGLSLLIFQQAAVVAAAEKCADLVKGL